MTSTASWAALGVGICGHCDAPRFLYTHSLAPHAESYYGHMAEGSNFCLECSLYGINALARNTREYNSEYEIISYGRFGDDLTELQRNLPNASWESEHECCAACKKPYSEEKEMWGKVDALASTQDGSTIIVQAHKSCSVTPPCCDSTYLFNWASWQSVNIHTFEGKKTCQHCLAKKLEERRHTAREYFTCGHCDSWWNLEYRVRFRGGSFCQTCHDDYVHTCGDCDNQYWEGDDHYCPEYEDDSESFIHDYGWKPRPYFFGKENGQRLYFGIELEVENFGNKGIEQMAEMVQDALGERVYLKHDGSLNDGFEIVTHPHSLDAFRKDFNWEAFPRFRREGLRSWDTTTCGLHVHVSRDAFGAPFDYRTNNRAEHIKSRQTHEIKFIKLIYDNDRQICRLAGRRNDEYANFSDKGNVVRKVKWDETRGGRHSAVNTQNDSTLEVRVFKGSLQPTRVLSAVELVHAAVEYTRDLKVTGPKSMVILSNGKARSNALSWLAFSGFVSNNADQYPNLAALMVKTFETDYLDE
jgi:hypothetical protein